MQGVSAHEPQTAGRLGYKSWHVVEARSYRPRSEKLEERLCFSAVTFSLSGSTLTVTGTDGNDEITLVGDSTVEIVTATETIDTSIDPSGLTNIRVHGRAGDDVITIDDSIVGASAHLYGDDGNDTLTGTDFNDILYGYAGNDVIYGGDGNDNIAGHEGDDQLFGEGGNDTLTGFDGDDILDGGEGNDLINGHGGADQVSAGGGDDRVYLDGDDTDVRGGDGNDSADARGSATGVTLDMTVEVSKSLTAVTSMTTSMPPDTPHALWSMATTATTL